ncbi:zinc finger protein 862-like [Ruditapes philippinarum]|uniref:zinc finger protein 862-like n=1 Tax=Ruditapes philippinarum TaxID=129788 RepID=UPI00295C2E81|nr:zinc finger protein 862-like [Ruditapes philippinarum]
MHCVNHRLELGALDAIKDRDAEMFSDIKSLLLRLHKHYHYSAKALRELKSLAEAMEVKMLKPANLEGTRWMPHLSRSLAVLLKPASYCVFVTHFEDIVQGGKGTADVQGRAKSILKHLKSEKLLHYMFFLQDVLEILSDLSLQFQRDTCSIPDALDALETACLRLVALQHRPGKHLQVFVDALDDQHVFQGIQLSPCTMSAEGLSSKKSLLIDAVINHISGRLQDLDTSPVLKSMQIFFMVNLPESATDLALYGEQEIGTLIQYFNPLLCRLGCQTDAIKDTEWPALKAHMSRNRQKSTEVLHKIIFTDDNLKERFKNILVLVEIILCVPTSSAICERGVSAMARIKSDWRASLNPDMLNYLMAISVSGPQVSDYNCTRALNMWYHGGQRQRRPQFDENDDVDELSN